LKKPLTVTATGFALLEEIKTFSRKISKLKIGKFLFSDFVFHGKLDESLALQSTSYHTLRTTKIIQNQGE